ncbi:MAG: carboxymuconolactone decarboxylase family protein [Pseudomonadota bacterium]
MTRLAPLAREDLPQHAAFFEVVERTMGFVPNSLPTMARKAGLLEGFAALAQAALPAEPEAVPRPLLQMCAVVASAAAGCRYCQAHTAATAARLGVSAEKVADLWLYETSPHFDDAERAALRFAQAAAENPGRADDATRADLIARHGETGLVEVTAVVALFGFLNRWNDAMATELEPEPAEFAAAHLARHGWEAGKHG